MISVLMVISVLLVALAHISFLVLEMFLWTRPTGLKIFRMKKAQAESTKVFAQNMGLYNGFLAAGLLWALWQGSVSNLLFFLLFIIAAGIYGGLISKRIIIYVQAVPAIIALFFVWLNTIIF